MELIDKETVYKELSEYYHHTAFIQHLCLAEALDRVPVVDAEPVRHGKWDYVTVAEEGYWKCSCCNFPTEAFGAKRLYKYCPFCGAKMDKQEEQNGS